MKNSLPLLAILALCAAPVYAADSVTTLNTVTVTASKTARNAFSVPAAISVIGSDDIAQGQTTRMDDILRRIPNFDSAGGPRRASQEPSLRGLSDRRIVIKVDGMRRNFRAQYGGRYFIDPSLLSQVEVTRGANSVLDGSGAIGGTIQMFTKSARDVLLPGQKTGYSLTSGLATGSQDFNTTASYYGISGGLDYIGAFTYRNSENVTAGGDTEIRDSESMLKNYFAKGSYDFGNGGTLTLTAQNYDDQSRMPASPFQPTSAINAATRRESEQTDLSLRYNYNDPTNTWLNLQSVLYHSDTQVDTLRYTDRRFDETDHKTTGFDVFNAADFELGGVGNTLTLGFETYHDEQDGTRNGGFRPLLGAAESWTYGVYAQNEIALSDALTIVPGIRYDRYDINPDNVGLRDQTNSEWSPKIAANYIFDPNWSGYASLAKAYRSPTITELYATGTLFPGNNLISNPNLQPETAINKELGLRYQEKNFLAKNDTLRARLSVFQNDVDDYIEQVISPTTTQFRNATKAKLRGIEFEGSYENAAWILAASGGFTRGENETLNQPLSDVPPAQATLSAIRKVDAWDMNFGYSTNMAAAQDRIPAGQPLITKTGGWMVHNLFMTWQPDDPKMNNMRVDFGVDNVFDNYYRRQLSFIPDEGRTIKMQVGWKF